MPYINVQLTAGVTREQKRRIVADVTTTLANVSGKRPEHTHVVIQEISEENWGYSGMLTDAWTREQSAVTEP